MNRIARRLAERMLRRMADRTTPAEQDLVRWLDRLMVSLPQIFREALDLVRRLEETEMRAGALATKYQTLASTLADRLTTLADQCTTAAEALAPYTRDKALEIGEKELH